MVKEEEEEEEEMALIAATRSGLELTTKVK